MNGLKDEIVIGSLKQHMYDDDLEVLFITEPHLSAIKQRAVQQVFSEFDVFIRSRKAKRNKQYQQRGGIMCIAKKDTVKLEKKCECDDMMWIDWKGIKVAGVYFVPSTSPFAKRNAKRMRELQQRVLEASGKVMILTDANAWIGNSPSTITKRDDKKLKIFNRASVKNEINTQGEWFISEMNSVDMIVLNGIKSEAQYTYDHPGREAKSIVDFIVANEQAFDIITDVAYSDCRESLCTDHILISVQVWHDLQPSIPKRKVKRVRRKKKPMMNFLRSVTRRDGFWKCLEQSLRDFVAILGQSIDEDYATFKSKLEEAVSTTLKNTKPIRTH